MDETGERVWNLTKKVHVDDDLQFLFGKKLSIIFISNPIILKSMLIRVRHN